MGSRKTKPNLSVLHLRVCVCHFYSSAEEAGFYGIGSVSRVIAFFMKLSSVIIVELQWLEHLWDHGNLFEIWVV